MCSPCVGSSSDLPACGGSVAEQLPQAGGSGTRSGLGETEQKGPWLQRKQETKTGKRQ